jgi:hypothetical protein
MLCLAWGYHQQNKNIEDNFFHEHSLKGISANRTINFVKKDEAKIYF